MSTMVVLGFKTEEGANQALKWLSEAQKEKLITLLDAAVVTRKEDGKPKIKQAYNLVAGGALGGAFWGMLIGLIFLMPLFGAAVGALSGAIGGLFTDIGINDDFIKQTGEAIQPGTSALFLLVQDATVDKLAERARAEGVEFDLISTSLSNEAEGNLRDAFGLDGEETAAAE